MSLTRLPRLPAPAQPFPPCLHLTGMVMITLPQPTSGFLILDDQGRPLGRVERPRDPDLGPGTVLLQRGMPKVEKRV